jgi:hypothetical protein
MMSTTRRWVKASRSKHQTRYNWPRRGAGVDERGGLENRCGPLGHRGFESHPLRLIC